MGLIVIQLWDIDTGECLHVLRGHYHQIYVVVFDGIRIASAGLDTTVRVWDAETGYAPEYLTHTIDFTHTERRNCLALLQGHTALVCQLQIDTSTSQLVTGGSDGRVITFSLLPHANFEAVHKIPAHDSSVTSLQIEGTRLVTAGMDGRVRVFDKRTGALVRELGSQSDTVWKVVAKGNGVAVCCRRNNRTVTEIWGFKPEEEEMQGLHQLFR
jgi:F-box and WD-40 domain protein CDC4